MRGKPCDEFLKCLNACDAFLIILTFNLNNHFFDEFCLPKLFSLKMIPFNPSLILVLFLRIWEEFKGCFVVGEVELSGGDDILILVDKQQIHFINKKILNYSNYFLIQNNCANFFI